MYQSIVGLGRVHIAVMWLGGGGVEGTFVAVSINRRLQGLVGFAVLLILAPLASSLHRLAMVLCLPFRPCRVAVAADVGFGVIYQRAGVLVG